LILMPNELMRHVPKGALIVVMTFCTNHTIRENPGAFILIIARSFPFASAFVVPPAVGE